MISCSQFAPILSQPQNSSELEKNIINSFNSISQYGIPSFIAESKRFIEKDIQFFRRFFYENNGYGDIELLLTPYEIMVELAKNPHVMEAPSKYGHVKFQQLTYFIQQTNSDTFVSKQEQIDLLLAKKFFRF